LPKPVLIRIEIDDFGMKERWVKMTDRGNERERENEDGVTGIVHICFQQWSNRNTYGADKKRVPRTLARELKRLTQPSTVRQ